MELIAAAENYRAVARTVWVHFLNGEARINTDDFEKLENAHVALCEALNKDGERHG